MLNEDARVYIDNSPDKPLSASEIKNAEIEKIKSLEKEEVLAVTNNDTVSLFKLWSPDIVVTNADNQLETWTELCAGLRQNKKHVGLPDRKIDKISLTDNVAIVMGVETLLSSAVKTEQIKPAKRRYTSVWTKKGEVWQLAARQVTNL